ncbi:hypothetical protein BN938_0824 [Mucinivorans hirudinis]|uniref:Uncharacterized protein n=1 Tax=Mucinivorans hirudinis TaxID=1433126 RepID=A0A060R719_9BACT|nr:hypothetical protein BN938_0824 [Mucinivorans hirudinis]
MHREVKKSAVFHKQHSEKLIEREFPKKQFSVVELVEMKVVSTGSTTEPSIVATV